MEVREKRERVAGLHAGPLRGMFYNLQLQLQRLHSANLPHGYPRQNNHHGHLQDELEEVRDQDPPQSADRGINSGKRYQDKDADRKARMRGIAEDVVRQRVPTHRELDAASRLNQRASQN